MAGVEPIACFGNTTSKTRSSYAQIASASQWATGSKQYKRARLSQCPQKRYRCSRTFRTSAPGSN
eukprot:7081720-Karenia_brevis.AAC.1